MQVLLQTPILLESELDNIKANSGLQLQSFSLHYETGHPDALKEALSGLCSNIEEQVSMPGHLCLAGLCLACKLLQAIARLASLHP